MHEAGGSGAPLRTGGVRLTHTDPRWVGAFGAAESFLIDGYCFFLEGRFWKPHGLWICPGAFERRVELVTTTFYF